MAKDLMYYRTTTKRYSQFADKHLLVMGRFTGMLAQALGLPEKVQNKAVCWLSVYVCNIPQVVRIRVGGGQTVVITGDLLKQVQNTLYLAI